VLVTAKGFGGIWERRLGKDTGNATRFAETAFYNTTGVLVKGKVRYRWRIGGKIRFNGVGGFTPGNPSSSLNRVFECKEPETTRAGWTQILFRRMLSGPERPDFYLFVVTAEDMGRLDIRSSWKADSVQVVALSEHDDQQEAMLLMPAYSWVRGQLGTFYAEPSAKQFWSAGLRLERAGLAG
jgi:hypothetical protein